jgi:hypothetical protein
MTADTVAQPSMPPGVFTHGDDAHTAEMRTSESLLGQGPAHASSLHASSLLRSLRARGSGVLAALVTSAAAPQPQPLHQSPVGAAISPGKIAPADVKPGELPAAESFSAPRSWELEPMKVDLPPYFPSSQTPGVLPTLLDPRLPAKKMPRFAEFCDSAPDPCQQSAALDPRPLEPLLLSHHLPSTTALGGATATSTSLLQRRVVEAR